MLDTTRFENVTTRKSRTRKADKGHSVVASERGTDYRGITREALRCECGKEFTGWGATAFYSHQKHLRQAVSN